MTASAPIHRDLTLLSISPLQGEEREGQFVASFYEERIGMRYMCVGSRERAIVALPSSLGEDELREVMEDCRQRFLAGDY